MWFLFWHRPHLCKRVGCSSIPLQWTLDGIGDVAGRIPLCLLVQLLESFIRVLSLLFIVPGEASGGFLEHAVRTRETEHNLCKGTWLQSLDWWGRRVAERLRVSLHYGKKHCLKNITMQICMQASQSLGNGTGYESNQSIKLLLSRISCLSYNCLRSVSKHAWTYRIMVLR